MYRIKSIKNISGGIAKVLSRASSYRIINIRKLHTIVEIEHLKRVLERFSVDCVFDVGANDGQYATQLRKKVGYKGLIISFEPIPESAQIIREKSKNDPRWIVEECALSTSDGHHTFHVMADSQFSSLSNPRHDETSLFLNSNKTVRDIVVKTETLDTAFGRLAEIYSFERPFLKMDTQGYDLEVVEHGKNVLHKFLGLQSELAIRKLYENSIGFRDAISRYEQLGFYLSGFIPNNGILSPRMIETDCIMVRNDSK